NAQLSHGGEPHGWHNDVELNGPPLIVLPPIDHGRSASGPDQHGEFKYGEQRFLAVDVIAQGEWQDLDDGSRICRIAIESEGASMLSVQFDRWELPEGAKVFLFDRERTRFIGGFDGSNRTP